MSNDDLVSKLVVFFTLGAVVPQTDILLGKPRDFKAFSLIFARQIELCYIFLCQCEILIF